MPDKKESALAPRRMPHQNWRTIANLPSSTPGQNVVTVVFHGLLSFCYDPASHFAEVGAFSKRFSPEHQFKIKVKGGSCDGLVLGGDDIGEGDLVLQIVGPGAPDGAFRYQTGADFDRLSEATNPRDFRWVLDLEGPDFYDEIIGQKYEDYYTHKLKVRNGVFYTLDRTASTFRRVNLVNSTDIRRLGKMAFCVAANLAFSAGQAVQLTIPGQPYPCSFPYDPNVTDYKIYYTNNCQRGGAVCDDSDFFHHSHSFDPPVGKGRYRLEVENPVSGATHDCAGLQIDEKKSTDEAPCGGAGYGGSPGMPPP